MTSLLARPLEYIVVSCSETPESQMDRAMHIHQGASVEMDAIRLKIKELGIAEETLFHARKMCNESGLNALIENPEESYLDFIESNVLSADDLSRYLISVHEKRMNLYPVLEEVKAERKKAFHTLKRLSFVVTDGEAYRYYTKEVGDEKH